MKLYYYYDPEADVFYFSKGKPSRSDQSLEAPDDVTVRLDPKSGTIRGFTVLNFLRRLRNKGSPVSLPIETELMPAGRF